MTDSSALAGKVAVGSTLSIIHGIQSLGAPEEETNYLWAYVVLGWGGYWGWDPVENASLLSWLVGVALIHTFTVYRQRGAFKRWGVMCACLVFTFVTPSSIARR